MITNQIDEILRTFGQKEKVAYLNTLRDRLFILHKRPISDFDLLLADEATHLLVAFEVIKKYNPKPNLDA